MAQIRDLIESDLKTHHDLVGIAVHYVNYYFHHAKPFTENHFVIKMYADYVYFDLINFLVSIYHNKLKDNVEEEIITNFNWKESILNAKISTYSKRKKILKDWIHNVNNGDKLFRGLKIVKKEFNKTDKRNKKRLQLENKLNYLSLLTSLTMCYNLDQIKDVKKELGLTISLQELQELKKEI